MSTLEERIAEAIYEEARRQGVSLGIFTADHLARAVVAVLPMSDVSDEAIYLAKQDVIDKVRALLTTGDTESDYVNKWEIRAALDGDA